MFGIAPVVAVFKLTLRHLLRFAMFQESTAHAAAPVALPVRRRKIKTASN